MIIDKKIIGANIRKIRLDKGLNLQALGEILGVSGTTISHWEKGRNAPSPRNLQKLVEALEVSIIEITSHRIFEIKNDKPFLHMPRDAATIYQDRKRWIRNAGILVRWAEEVPEKVNDMPPWVYDRFCREWAAAYIPGKDLRPDEVTGILESIKEEGRK